jgi:hypothetical protein
MVQRSRTNVATKSHAATGDPTPERYGRLDEAVDHFSKTWNHAKRAQLKVTIEQINRRSRFGLSVLSHWELKKFCEPQVMMDFQDRRFEIRRKLSISHNLLAAAELLCWRLTATHRNNPRAVAAT